VALLSVSSSAAPIRAQAAEGSDPLEEVKRDLLETPTGQDLGARFPRAAYKLLDAAIISGAEIPGLAGRHTASAIELSDALPTSRRASTLAHEWVHSMLLEALYPCAPSALSCTGVNWGYAAKLVASPHGELLAYGLQELVAAPGSTTIREGLDRSRASAEEATGDREPLARRAWIEQLCRSAPCESSSLSPRTLLTAAYVLLTTVGGITPPLALETLRTLDPEFDP
jgi:hypothetical protein